MFLLVPAYPGCPGSKAVKRSLLLLLLFVKQNNIGTCMNSKVKCVFSALMLLVGRQDEHLVCKN